MAEIVWTKEKREEFWEHLTEVFPRVPEECFFLDGTQEGPFKKHKTSVLSCKFSPIANQMASAGGGRIPWADRSIRIWDTDSGKELLVLVAHFRGIYDLAFDPKSGILASASEDYSVFLWNLEEKDVIFLTGQGIDGQAIVKGHVEFSEDSLLIAIGETKSYEDVGSSIFILNLETGQEVFRHTLDEDDAISAMAFSPDGNDLTFASDKWDRTDETVIWRYDVAENTANWSLLLRKMAVRALYDLHSHKVIIASMQAEIHREYVCYLATIDPDNGRLEKNTPHLA